MIELLTVVTIILVLVGLLLVMIPWVQYAARALQTTTRMEALTQAFTRLGQQEGSTAYILQRDANPLTGPKDYLGGTLTYRYQSALEMSKITDPTALQKAANSAIPDIGSWPTCYPPDPGVKKPLVMAYPWGKNRLYYIMENWYAGGMKPSLPMSFSSDKDQAKKDKETWEAPEPHNLIELRPFRTIELLKVAGVLLPDNPSTLSVDEGVDAFMKDRGRSQPWNDAWGNPLVVGIALFQPTICGMASGTYKTDYYLKESLKVYQYNRSVYVAVAAGGPTLRKQQLVSTNLADWTDVNLPDIWVMANEVCQKATTSWTPGQVWSPTPAQVWDETSFDHAPWQGVKQGLKKEGGKELRPLLTAPIEIH